MQRVRLRPIIASAHVPFIDLAPGESRTLGRTGDADLVLDDPQLWGIHARLSVDANGRLTVESLGAADGVMVNGVPTATAALEVGDRVRLGGVEYAVIAGEAARSSPRQVAGPTIVRVPVRSVTPRVDVGALEALFSTSRELMAAGDLPTLLECVLDRVQPIVSPDRVAILLLDSATGALVTRAVRPIESHAWVSHFTSSAIVREALNSRDVLLIRDPAPQSRGQDGPSLPPGASLSAICIPLFGRTGAIGALYAERVGSGDGFAADLAEHAAAFASLAAAALETARMHDDREQRFRATLEAFARAIDARDPYTLRHSERVTAYTLLLARSAGLPEDQLETIRRAAMVHDIGKVGVRDVVLLKNGPLDSAERAAMEAHVLIGYHMLEGLPFLADALPSVRGHHERWDGRGYPDRLAGAAIHPHARLMAVGDTYDAMTSARPFREALSREEAARRIRAEPGAQLDPAAVDLFDTVEPEFNAIRQGTRHLADQTTR